MKKLYVLLAFVTFCFSSVSSKAQLTEGTPVRISSFNISNYNKEVKLQWTVACGLQMAYFEIQRSVDGKDFKTIHQFSADRLRCQQPFDYTDNSAANENYYRIKVGDIDGNFTQERILFISTKIITGTSVAVINPVRGNTLQLSFMTENPTDIELRLVGINGRELEKIKLSISAGNSSSTWQVPNIPNGVYFVGYANNSNSIHGVSRFLKLP